MNNTTGRRIGRYLAPPVMAAGIIGGAALGLAGTASAAATTPDVRTGIVAVPQTKAQPATNAVPGSWWKRHKAYLYPPSTARDFVMSGR